MYCGINLSINKCKDISLIVKEVNKQLYNKVTKEKISGMLFLTKKYIKFFNHIRLLIKRTGTRSIYNYFSSCVFTNVFFNLCVIEFPNYIANNIESRISF